MKSRFKKFIGDKRKVITVLTLVFVIFVGFFLRFYKLGQVPSSLNWDEVSWGYNAYSVLQTGKDEYGNFLPLSFKAFGDFKQPVYVYADVPFVKFFGLNPFSVRAPSAFFGTLSILFVFLLTLELFRKNQRGLEIALITSLFYSISPWSIQFSRVAYEANLALFFIIAGSWAFIRGMNGNRLKLLVPGVVLLAVSTYTYHSAKIFTPLLFLFLLFFGVWFSGVKKKLALVLLGLFIVLNFFWVVDMRTTQRGRSVLFISNPSVVETSIQENLYDKNHGDVLGQITHNRRIVWAYKYAENYLSHFDFNWLFIRGDNPRHHTPGMGNLYLVNLIFILLGIFTLLKKFDKNSIILFAWALLGPVASALAVDSPNASRSMAMLPTWDIFAAVGWVTFAVFLGTKPKLKTVILIPIILITFNFTYYVHQYFVHTDTQVQKDWQYGYKEAMLFTQKFSGSDKNIIFSSKFEQPYVFYLFYNKYDPAKYIKDGGTYRIWQNCSSINNTYFGNCLDKLQKGDIYVALGDEVLSDARELKTFDYAYSGRAVTIYEKQ